MTKMAAVLRRYASERNGMTGPVVTPVRPSSSAVQQNKAPSVELLGSMTKEQLRAECKRRGQKLTGNKVELLSRLGYYKLTAAAAAASKTVSTSGTAAADQDGAGAVQGKAKVKLHAQKNGGDGIKSNKEIPPRIRSAIMETASEREHLVLWRRPITTIEYFSREMLILLSQTVNRISAHKVWLVLSVVLSVLTFVMFHVKGSHQPYMESAFGLIWWWCWWVLLGVLSSVGLGTGLHTFLLYLGPHIAKVTLAAYECGALNFPEPPYPNEIICPTTVDPEWSVSIWNIMAKVRVEAMLWGLGTALGELPPYFMARAARLSSGAKVAHLNNVDPNDDSFVARAKQMVQRLVEKVGFLGILACASIPNPLFDLAGLTCGHFLVPFWTFFGATLLGKAVVKMHIQKMFVIIAFNEALIGQALTWLKVIPHLGPRLEEPLLEFLQGQRTKLHGTGGEGGGTHGHGGSLLASLLEKLVLAMVVFFLVSIVNSLAQSYHARLSQATKGAPVRKTKKQKD